MSDGVPHHWRCIRCNSVVDMEQFKCNCVTSPSPWEPVYLDSPDAAICSLKRKHRPEYKTASEWEVHDAIKKRKMTICSFKKLPRHEKES